MTHAASDARPVILMVDDEPEVREIFAIAMERWLPGYAVEQASSSAEAIRVLDRLEGAPLALVVADHRLGGDTGVDLMGLVQQRFPDSARLLFTGQASAFDEQRARDLGAEVLWKPVRLQEFLDTVTALIDRRSAA